MCQFLSVTGAVKGIENPALLRSGGTVRGCARNASSLTVSHPCFARSDRAQMSLAGLLASGRVCKLSCPECVPSRRCLFLASGFVRTRSGNSGATAADSHRFPFSPDSNTSFWDFSPNTGDVLFNCFEGYVAESVQSNGWLGAVRSSFPARSVAE